MTHRHLLVLRPDTMDRFTSLPDTIAYAILGRLSMKEVARLQLVSKTCLSLSKSLPYLSFSTSSRDVEANQYIDQLIDFHEHYGVKISKLHLELRWSFEGMEEHSRLSKWLSQAAELCLEELHLDIKPSPTLELPYPLCNSKSIRKLVINLNNGTLSLPPRDSLSNLEYLKLENSLIQSDFLEKLVLQCKNLRQLHLICCCNGMNDLSISSSSLEILILRAGYGYHLCHLIVTTKNLSDLVLEWGPVPSTDPSSFTISAPKLKKFYWVGFPVNYFRSLRRFSCLEKASLSLVKAPYNNREIYYCPNLDYVVDSLARVSKLYLHIFSVRVLVSWCAIQHHSFDHVRELTVNAPYLEDYQVIPLAALLTASPNLHFLQLTSGMFRNSTYTDRARAVVPYPDFNGDFWKLQEVCFDQLKVLVIELFPGSIVLELLKYILQHANELEQLTVYHSTPVFPDAATRVIDDCKKSSTSLTVLERN